MPGRLQNSGPAPTGKCSRKSFGAIATDGNFCRLPAALGMLFLLPRGVDGVEEQAERRVRLAAMLRPERKQHRATLA